MCIRDSLPAGSAAVFEFSGWYSSFSSFDFDYRHHTQFMAFGKPHQDDCDEIQIPTTERQLPQIISCGGWHSDSFDFQNRGHSFGYRLLHCDFGGFSKTVIE